MVHENRGLNLHIEDVARRTAIAGFLAFAPDALTPLGGYPGNDDDGRTLQGQRDRGEMQEDFVAAGGFLKSHRRMQRAVGVVGFCYGGGICNMMAVRIPDLGASVPFYGSQPAVEDVPRINAPLLIHYAGLDQRINTGWPAYEAALKANGKTYTMHMYEGANHGFHNDTTPRYDEAAPRWHGSGPSTSSTGRCAERIARKWANFTDYDSLGSGTPALDRMGRSPGSSRLSLLGRTRTSAPSIPL